MHQLGGRYPTISRLFLVLLIYSICSQTYSASSHGQLTAPFRNTNLNMSPNSQPIGRSVSRKPVPAAITAIVAAKEDAVLIKSDSLAPISANIGHSYSTSVKSILLRTVLGLWGVGQVIIILGNALKRLLPVAVQPFIANDLLPYQWALFGVWTGYMAYAEGYKAFHLKFSPMVVDRAFGIYLDPSLLKVVLAGPYSMGLFGAPKKRMIVSWSITAGVYALVKIVKRLPYPYRSIVDAGVVAGLSLGSLSMAFKALMAVFKPSRNDSDSQ